MSKAFKWLMFLLLLLVIALAVLYRDQLDAEVLKQLLEQAGPAAPLLFIVLYAIATVIFLPGSLLTLIGGALFGPLLGTFYNLTGATIGATLAFLVARYLASDWVEEKAGGQLRRLKLGVENEGWRFVAFVRLVPLFPFNLLNYALGLTRIRLSHYLMATYICMLPGAIAYTYLGYAGREALGGGEGLIQKGLLALALFATVLFVPRIIGHLRQGQTINLEELRQKLMEQQELLLLDVRTENDYRGEFGHITGSTNIPLEQLGQRLDEVISYQEKPVALICTTDRRSKKAAKILIQQGFSDVHVVSEGMKQWSEKSYSVVRN